MPCFFGSLALFSQLFSATPAGYRLVGDARGGAVGLPQHERAAVAATALAWPRGLPRQLPRDAGLCRSSVRDQQQPDALPSRRSPASAGRKLTDSLTKLLVRPWRLRPAAWYLRASRRRHLASRKLQIITNALRLSNPACLFLHLLRPSCAAPQADRSRVLQQCLARISQEVEAAAAQGVAVR